MEKLYSKLENNYFTEIREYLTFLISKGYILVNEGEKKAIYGYSARLNDFLPKYTLTNFIHHLQDKVPNYFDIIVTIQDLINIVVDTLPYATIDDIDNFKAYVEAKKYLKDSKILEADKKKLDKQIQEQKRNIFKNAPNDVQEQIRALHNNGVVYCQYFPSNSVLKRHGFFVFDKASQKYDLLSLSSICTILKKEFSFDFDERRIENNLKAYRKGLIESNLPNEWNINCERKKIIENFKNPTLDGSQWV